eukprot:m.66686 g.66686  ORF g.66686 m.66686 type:complete len:287 (-) comp12133_c0_seq1:184-1044(-)
MAIKTKARKPRKRGTPKGQAAPRPLPEPAVAAAAAADVVEDVEEIGAAEEGAVEQPLAFGASGDESDQEAEDAEEVSADKNGAAAKKSGRQFELDASTVATIKAEIGKASKSKASKSKAKKETKRMAAKRAQAKRNSRGVVYIGHIPYGFFEPQMQKYFGQFGEVSRLRLSRSPKTGGSRGYAFVEFLDKEVAEIVAKTMNNYLMFDKILQCRVMDTSEVHEQLFRQPKRANKRLTQARARNQDRTEAQQSKRAHKLRLRDKQTHDKLTAAGIDYDFVGYTAAQTN